MIRVPKSVSAHGLLWATLFCAVLVGSQALAVNPFLLPEPVTVRKAPAAQASSTLTYLTQHPGSTARIWVFFTDKGVFSRTQFDVAAASVSLDKAMKRRAKTGMDHVVFADLPVPQMYIDQITALGAKYRRTSLWLNGATFEVDASQLATIAALPFVAEVMPMATYKETLPKAEEVRESPVPTVENSEVLNYGSSAPQLSQINVIAAHNQGYDGTGVILAMFDTGFRKTHQAFAKHFLEGRVLAEHDFIFNDGNTANEAGDAAGQWDHGTLTWSTATGNRDGKLYGPAYHASYILCKTEDTRSETQVEEDNWVAALEFVSGLGADVISSSLGYMTFDGGSGYVESDMNGATAITSKAASMCDSLGIVLCNSMGNAGPGAMSISAPADAFNILSVGAVSAAGTIASFSSRGPTADGRTKPEVCAMGVGTYCATSSNDSSYGTASGTSLSTPLVAGATCLMIQAHPDWPPSLIRDAMRLTASRASTPDNTYGWGILNLDAALGYGVSLSVDNRFGNAPLSVNFTGSSSLSPTSWLWDFGDGNTSTDQNPSHTYQNTGIYDVSLTVQTTSFGQLQTTRPGYILATGDTLAFETDSVYAGQQIQISVNLKNTQALDQIIVPLKVGKVPFSAQVDSISLGTRTATNWTKTLIGVDAGNKKWCYALEPSGGGGPLPPGSGEILRIWLRTDKNALGSLSVKVDTSNVNATAPSLHASSVATTYYPVNVAGAARTRYILRGNVDNLPDLNIDIGDLTALLGYLFLSGQAPVTIQSGDTEPNFNIDIGDVTELINYLFLGGPPPPTP